MPYNPEEGDDFESAWLLLANIHLGSGKIELARDFCDSALAHNASSGRALTIRGACAEASGDFQVLFLTFLPSHCVLFVLPKLLWCAAVTLFVGKLVTGVPGYMICVYGRLGGMQVAAESYERAWRLTGASNPALGYQLAWNLLKACRNVDAADVALQVWSR